MSEDWKNKGIQPYLKGKPANWSDTDNDWVAFKGNEKLEQELASIKKTQSEILERLDKPIDTQVTGSNVEYPFVDKDYEGGVIQTRTMGLSWKAFDLFDENIFVPSGAYVDRKSDGAQVNGFSTIGIIVRDERGGSVAKHNFDVHIYWQGIEGGFAPSKAVNEVISFNDEDEGSGLSVSVPTKSEFISFRLFNRSDEDRTYLAKGILRA